MQTRRAQRTDRVTDSLLIHSVQCHSTAIRSNVHRTDYTVYLEIFARRGSGEFDAFRVSSVDLDTESTVEYTGNVTVNTVQ